MGFYALLGALRDVDISCVEEISGASAGAIIALFLCVGLTVPQILERTLMLDIESYLSLDLVSLMTKYGLVRSSRKAAEGRRYSETKTHKCSTQSSFDQVKKLLVKICGRDPTFKDLSIKMHVSTFCVDTGDTVYFSRDTVPNGRCESTSHRRVDHADKRDLQGH